jgi:hypothetical protein
MARTSHDCSGIFLYSSQRLGCTPEQSPREDIDLVADVLRRIADSLNYVQTNQLATVESFGRLLEELVGVDEAGDD